MNRVMSAALVGLAIMSLEPTPAPAQATVLVKKGAQIDGTLNDTLDSGKDQSGMSFSLKEREGFFVKSPAINGATIEGHIENVHPANGAKLQAATMNIIIDDIKLVDGTLIQPVHITLKDLKDVTPKTHHVRDSLIIAGGAITGHVISKHTGHGGGTLAGAAAGVALVNTMKSNIVLKRGTLIRLRTNADILSPG